MTATSCEKSLWLGGSYNRKPANLRYYAKVRNSIPYILPLGIQPAEFRRFTKPEYNASSALRVVGPCNQLACGLRYYYQSAPEYLSASV